MNEVPPVNNVKATITVKHIISLPQADGTSVALDLAYADNTRINGTLIYDGGVARLFVPNSKVDAVSYVLAAEPAELVSQFDAFGTQTNAVDGDWLVELLLAKADEVNARASVDEQSFGDLQAAIKRLSVVINVQTLYTLGHTVMVQLYGYNWVAEQTGNLIRQSKGYKSLVKAVELAQEGLKNAISS